MSLRRFLMGILLTLLLISVIPAAAQEAEATGEATPEVPTGYQVPGFPAYAAAPTMLEVVEDRGDTLLVRHLMGETEIPKHPQRVYADASTLDILISLGITPVGANSSYVEGEEPSPTLAPLLEGVELFPRGPANLESILSLAPDLILVWDIPVTWNEGSSSFYDLLSAIAPTVVLRENSFTFWQQATRDIATLFGVPERADALIAEYEQAVTTQCERIRTVIPADETLTLLLVQPDLIRIVGPGYLTDTGFIPVAVTSWAYQDCQILPGAEVSGILGTEFSSELSLELLPQIQADHVGLIVADAAEDTYQERIEQPLWASVPAVERGTVYRLPFLTGSSYYSALWTLEQFADVITGTSSVQPEATEAASG